MKKVIIKNSILFFVFAILFFGLFVIWDNIVKYYDLVCVIVFTIPLILLIRFLDDYMRDFIIILRENETLVATLISGAILIFSFLFAYYFYNNILDGKDIFVNICDFLEQFLPIKSIRDQFNIY